jgi:putative PIN family toxin of toxin-antitoxin system
MDTSVLFQALYSNAGASHAILRLIREGAVKLAISVPVFGEYQDVLRRPEKLKELGRSAQEMSTVLNFIAFIGRPFPVYFRMRPNLRDENDNAFVELAFASGSSHLITKNIRDFTVDSDLRLDQLRIVTPAQFMKEWREKHGD